MRNLKKRKNNFFLFYLPEICVAIFAFLSRFIRLAFPPTYIFDEVYHAFTAGQMLKGNPAAWEWWNTAPPGFAYEWTHPPLAKEFMVIGMIFFGDNTFGWRFFSAIFGFGSIVLIYFLAKKLFNSRRIALFSSLAVSFDGLFLVMSRIGMNDMYYMFFALLAFLFFLYDRKYLMSICLGLSVVSKWTGMFGIGILGVFYFLPLLRGLLFKKIDKVYFFKRFLMAFVFFIFIPAAVYVAAYTPFFLGHHSPPREHWSNLHTFIDLQQQMWIYHTTLKATHPYSSVPIQWMLDLRPVWFYVSTKGSKIANIYTLGNPLFMWFGLISIFIAIFNFAKKPKLNILLVVFAYFGFFLPWQWSPRIMFHYHYLPAVPFLGIAIGYVLDLAIKKYKYGKILATSFFIMLAVLFVYFYPLWTGVYLPACPPTGHCISWYNSYFWFPSWR